jgi:hypothetical protein
MHDPETSVWLIDLVGVERYRTLPRRRKVQNLARLNASFHGRTCLSRTDRLRFLRKYLTGCPHDQSNWKKWWKQIERATEKKISRNRRLGRPMA